MQNILKSDSASLPQVHTIFIESFTKKNYFIKTLHYFNGGISDPKVKWLAQCYTTKTKQNKP